jgi:hypothetical protein
MQTTSIAAAAWIYLVNQHGIPETPTKISTYVYRPTLLLFLSGLSPLYGKLVLCMYLCILSR